MDINIGTKVKYSFPDSSQTSKDFAIGIIESVYESYVVMKTEENIKIKINFKNFENVEILDQIDKINLPKPV